MMNYDENYFTIKYIDEDGNDMWLRWTHWANDISGGFFHSRRATLKTIFKESNYGCTEFVNQLKTQNYIICDVDMEYVKKHRLHIFPYTD